MKEHLGEWAMWDKVTLPRIFANRSIGEDEKGIWDERLHLEVS